MRQWPRIAVAFACAVALLAGCAGQEAPDSGPTQMEYLDRGLVAVEVPDGVYLSWRLLGTDRFDTPFDVYRDGELVAKVTDSTTYLDGAGTPADTYLVAPAGEEPLEEPAHVLGEAVVRVPLDVPEGGVSPDGVAFSYTANDATCADLDGDGKYELVLKWDPPTRATAPCRASRATSLSTPTGLTAGASGAST